MSWHYLPELVEGFSVQPSWDGDPSEPWKSNRTVGKSSCGVSGTVCCQCSQSGTMWLPYQFPHIVEWWISSLPASRVSRSALPESGKGKAMSATFGPTPSESFARYDPDTHSWRTCQGSLLPDISDAFSETWPRAGTMRDGMCWERTTLVPRTDGTGYGLHVPTPRASDGPDPSSHGRSWSATDYNLHNFVRLWPTPTQDSASQRKGRYKQGGLPLAAAVTMWATPQAHDSTTGNAKRVGRYGTKHGARNLNDEVAMWPTPNVPNGGRTMRPEEIRAKGATAKGKRQVGLENAVKLWPTPKAEDSQCAGGHRGTADTLHAAVKKWPTPNVSDGKGPNTRAEGKDRSPADDDLPTRAGGQLNPPWVEWLMGWPIGWTDLEPLATDRYREWLEQHGGY